MKKLIAVLGAVVAMTAIAAPTFAADKMTSTKMSAKPAMTSSKTLKCPSCGMPMPTKKTTVMTVPIKVKGVTYYCCAECPSGKKAAAANAKMKKM